MIRISYNVLFFSESDLANQNIELHFEDTDGRPKCVPLPVEGNMPVREVSAQISITLCCKSLFTMSWFVFWSHVQIENMSWVDFNSDIVV